jgi:hypothetical protein
MFEAKKTESFPRRVAGALAVLPRRYTAALLGVIVLLLPYSTTVVPEWKVRVVDQHGRPVAGVVVSESWQDYSLEGEGHEEDRLTDEAGYVTFPERKIWSPLGWRIISTGMAAFLTLAHGSMGPHATVMVSGGGVKWYGPGEPLPAVIQLER